MLLIRQRRDEYFKEANKLRERGQSTAHLHDPDITDPQRRLHAASSRAALQIGTCLMDQGVHSKLANMLMDYVEGRLDDNIVPK